MLIHALALEMSVAEVRLIPITGLPEILPGADLGALLLGALATSEVALQPSDVVVVTHKVVAKAEGALVDLRSVSPSPFAQQYAERWGKDPRQIEVVLRQSVRVVRMDHGVILTETRHGFICANAGVDGSNMPDEHTICLLPDDPDASAARVAATLARQSGMELPVIVTDTFGRPWREGLTNVAIGVAGLRPLLDYVGRLDPQGRELRVSVLAVADELAAAAELVMGKLDRVPAAIVRGYRYQPGTGSARELLRRPELDMFR
jgi:coenzyme F420-0:L-glutamate ligase / coenzyme F420-1:gamma-L-glutamate ligase